MKTGTKPFFKWCKILLYHNLTSLNHCCEPFICLVTIKRKLNLNYCCVLKILFLRYLKYRIHNTLVFCKSASSLISLNLSCVLKFDSTKLICLGHLDRRPWDTPFCFSGSRYKLLLVSLIINCRSQCYSKTYKCHQLEVRHIFN